MGQKKSVFVITPIGPPESRDRNRADDLLELLIEPVLEKLSQQTGDRYVALRADKGSKPGSITMEIVRSIVESCVVVVDQSGLNANVFYEMGIADAFGKPTVRIADDLDSIPFDSKDHNSIYLPGTDSGRLLARDIAECAAELEAHLVEAVKEGFRPSSIVTAYGHHVTIGEITGRLAQSGSETDKGLSAIMEILESLDKRVNVLASSARGRERLGRVPTPRVVPPSSTYTHRPYRISTPMPERIIDLGASSQLGPSTLDIVDRALARWYGFTKAFTRNGRSVDVIAALAERWGDQSGDLVALASALAESDLADVGDDLYTAAARALLAIAASEIVDS